MATSAELVAQALVETGAEFEKGFKDLIKSIYKSKDALMIMVSEHDALVTDATKAWDGDGVFDLRAYHSKLSNIRNKYLDR